MESLAGCTPEIMTDNQGQNECLLYLFPDQFWLPFIQFSSSVCHSLDPDYLSFCFISEFSFQRVFTMTNSSVESRRLSNFEVKLPLEFNFSIFAFFQFHIWPFVYIFEHFHTLITYMAYCTCWAQLIKLYFPSSCRMAKTKGVLVHTSSHVIFLRSSTECLSSVWQWRTQTEPQTRHRPPSPSTKPRTTGLWPMLVQTRSELLLSCLSSLMP